MARKNEIQIIITAIDKASGVLKKTGLSLEGLGKAGLIAGGAIAAMAAGVGIAAFNLAKDAAPVEGIRNAFNGLTADMEGGSKRILDALEESSYGMVKQSELMKSFNAASQLVSKDFAGKMPEAMQYLAKVSAATGQDMGFMIDSMVKGVGRLSPMILDNLGIQVSLEEATTNAALAFGVAAGELSKAQIQTGMMNVIMEKLKTNTADMPEVAGTAAQQFAKLGAQFGNIKDAIGLKLLPLFQAVADKLSTWLSSDAGKATIDTFVGWLGNVIGSPNPPSGLTGIISYLMSGKIKSAVDLAFGTGSYEAIIRFLARVKKAVDDVNSAVNTIKTTWGTLKDTGYIPGRAGIGDWSNQASRWLGNNANGSSFIVPGHGSGDRPFGIGLTPGEHVTVTPKGQPVGMGLSLTVNINSAVNLADRAYAERELMPYIEAGVRQLLARSA